MPRVGDKHYGYDKKGRAMAKRAAKKTGRKVMYDRPMKKKASKRGRMRY